MKKGCWIAGAILITLGMIIFFIGAGLSAGSMEYQTAEKSFDGGIQSIHVDCTAEDVYIRPSTDGEFHVFCSVPSGAGYDIKVIEGTLTVTTQKEILDYFTFFDFGYEAKITIQLPVMNTAVCFESLTVDTASGDIHVAEQLLFRRCDLNTASGDVIFKGDVQGKMNIETTSGDITVEDVSQAPAYECILNSTSGSVTAKNLNATAFIVETTSGDVLLENCEFGALTANAVSGEIELEGVDADECYIRTTSGDVSAGFVKEMDFQCSSTSGDIETPPSAGNGGLCQIITTSGDIEVWIYTRNSASRSDRK